VPRGEFGRGTTQHTFNQTNEEKREKMLKNKSRDEKVDGVTIP
jgi:hypothetical protein